MILNITPQKIDAIHSIIGLVDGLIENQDLNLQEYPIYLNHCAELKTVLQQLLIIDHEEILFPFDNRQVYGRDHILPDGNVYEFDWYIPHLEKLIKISGNNIVRKKFKIGEVEQFVDYSGLENHRLPHAMQNQNPIYVVEYSPANLLLMVDGNHRVAARYNEYKDKEMLISGIYIPAEIHVKSLASTHQKIVFRVMTNINRIYIYLTMLSKGMKSKKPKLFKMDTYL